ncbi:MAG: mechanosensitive ion channel family protein [Bacillaceae bacterium]|nr:mechanosensitive ion channel family protein [Bacillaceae bacterium]
MNWYFWEEIHMETLVNLGISIGIFLLFLMFRKIFSKYIYKLLIRMMKKTPVDFLEQVFIAFEYPLRWLFLIIGIYVAADYFPFLEQSNKLFSSLISSSIIAIITWGLFNLASSSSVLFRKLGERTSIKIDEILIPLMSKTLRFIIVAISLSIIAQEFGYNVNGFVAGLGLGGMAIALAAQDAIKNLFGGVVIIAEKPFTLGDWIKTPSVEGTVEDITFRSTKVRTFAHSLVTVPNSTLANEPITNWSKMGKRRITFNLGVEYGTPKEKLQRVIQRIDDLLRNHEAIHQETIFVTFDQYNNSSLDIFLYFFTRTTNWGEFLKIKEEINFNIMDILEEEGVSVAFPSRTVYIEQGSEAIPFHEFSGQ